jgi:hypothetical protein
MSDLFEFPERSPLETSIIKLSNSLFNSFFSRLVFYDFAVQSTHPDFGGRRRVTTAGADVTVKISCSSFTTYGEYDVPKRVEFAVSDLEETWELVVRYDTTEPIDEDFIFEAGLRAETIPHTYIGGTGDAEAAKRWLMLWKLNHTDDEEE